MSTRGSRLVPNVDLERAALASTVLALLAYGVGDGVTTALLYTTPGVGESNPAVRALWPLGFLVAKVVVLAIPVAILELADRSGRVELAVSAVTFALVLALLGGYATWHNLLLI